MDDSSLERAAICDSVEDLDERFRGVDCLVAGLPCQPWSCAGKQEGKDDDRWLWPLFCEVIRKVEPKWIFLENVPGLVGGEMEGEPLDISTDDDSRGLSLILGSLADLGFSAEWLCLPASSVGASHRRNRWFCVAHRHQC
jgi:DNA (cytosine-5)-methyltransferase 1